MTDKDNIKKLLGNKINSALRKTLDKYSDETDVSIGSDFWKEYVKNGGGRPSHISSDF